MRKAILRGFAAAILVLVAGCAGQVPPVPGVADLLALEGVRAPADPAYLAALEAAKREGPGITKERLVALRAAWMRSPDFDPVMPTRLALRVQPRAGNDCTRAKAAAQAILAVHWLDLRSHAVLVACARREGDRAAEAQHMAIRDAIIEAMRATGDGSGPARPLTVISVDEEYALLEILGLRRMTRSVAERDGRRFDVLGVGDAAGGRVREMWFAIDPLLAFYARRGGAPLP